MKGRNITREEEQLIVLLYMSGKKPSEIVEITGLSKTTVFRMLHKAGIDTSPKKATEQPVNTEKPDISPILAEIAENTRRMVQALDKLVEAWCGKNE